MGRAFALALLILLAGALPRLAQTGIDIHFDGYGWAGGNPDAPSPGDTL